MTVTIGDILAAIDVVSELVNQCDSMDVEEALAIREAVFELESEAKRAESMLTTTAKAGLEGSARQMGERIYAVKPTGKWRFRHDELAAGIKAQAIGLDKDTGEMRSAEDAVDVAIQLMAEAYVTPSMEPKAGLREKLGYTEKRQLADWEKTGTTIVVTDLSAPEGAE